MTSEFVNLFENRLYISLINIGLDISLNIKMAVAVSGGADSICLLTALHRLLKQKKSPIQLKAITINHNIRPKEETEGDATFVQDYCKGLGIECIRIDIPKGSVFQLQKQRGLGIEEAARALRYEAFYNFINEYSIEFLCTAHNKNDQLETIVMRFLSGGDCGALAGIPRTRESFIRPLLDFSRSEIEDYLRELNIGFRTDKTNFDENLFRNCIRHKILPILKKEVSGWEKAVLSLSHKMYDDNRALDIITEEAINKIDFSLEKDCASFNYNSFLMQLAAVQRRLWYIAINDVQPKKRIPYSLYEKVIAHERDTKQWKENAAGIEVEFSSKSGRLFIRKIDSNLMLQNGDKVFFVIVEEQGEFFIADYVIQSYKKDNGIYFYTKINGKEHTLFVPYLNYPFIFRSRQSTDTVLSADGSFRNVSKVLEGFKCGDKKDKIPIIQELQTPLQQVVGIWGSFFTYTDWIVKEWQ